MSLRGREESLQPHAGWGENAFTIELRLMCPVDAKHHVGTLRATSGGQWKVEIRPTSTQTRASRTQARTTHEEQPWPTCHHCGEPAGTSIFAFVGEEDDDLACTEHDPGPETPAMLDARRHSILRFERDPKLAGAPTRLRWECCHCAVNWRRTNAHGTIPRPDNILRADRVLRLLHLMRKHGPSRLLVELDARALDLRARRITEESRQ